MRNRYLVLMLDTASDNGRQPAYLIQDPLRVTRVRRATLLEHILERVRSVFKRKDKIGNSPHSGARLGVQITPDQYIKLTRVAGLPDALKKKAAAARIELIEACAASGSIDVVV